MRPREQHRKVTYFSVFMFTITILEKVTHDVIFSLSSNKSRAKHVNECNKVFDSFLKTKKYIFFAHLQKIQNKVTKTESYSSTPSSIA